MEELKELIKIVGGHKTKFLDIVNPNDDSKTSRLYKTILSNPNIEDQEAFLSIYESEGDRSKFRQLKTRLEKRLINSLFLIDINKSSFNETNKAYSEAFRYWAAVKILFQRRSYLVGLRLAEKLYAHSIKYEIHEITIAIARDLRRIYGNEVENGKKHKKYKLEFDKYHFIYLCEINAEELTTKLHRLISKKTNYDYSELADGISNELKTLKNININSFLFNKFLYVASIYHEELSGNNEEIIKICNIAEEYFGAKKYPVEFTLAIFRSRKIIALKNMMQFQEAIENLEIVSNKNKTGSKNWHFSKVLHFLITMQMKNYTESLAIYKTSTTKLNLKGLSQNVLEFWRIFNAYLQFLIARKKIIIDDGDKKTFSINKFVNDVPQYSKDKQGLNVAIHIIHILFLLHRRKYNVIIDRMEPLQLYTYRHLRRDATFRSNCFIKMLVQLPKGNFVKKRVERYTQKYWEKLQTAPVDVNNQQMTLEIIPYEHLWEMVLEMLD